jgi:hypothetical protein
MQESQRICNDPVHALTFAGHSSDGQFYTCCLYQCLGGLSNYRYRGQDQFSMPEAKLTLLAMLDRRVYIISAAHCWLLICICCQIPSRPKQY